MLRGSMIAIYKYNEVNTRREKSCLSEMTELAQEKMRMNWP